MKATALMLLVLLAMIAASGASFPNPLNWS